MSVIAWGGWTSLSFFSVQCLAVTSLTVEQCDEELIRCPFMAEDLVARRAVGQEQRKERSMTESVENVAGETLDSYLFKEGNDLWFV